MEINEALQALSALGRVDDAREVLNTAAEAAQADYQRITADTRASDSYKKIRMAQAYVKYQGDVTEALSTIADKAAATDNEDAGQVFGTKNLSGDPASLAISRRDAADRVAAITKPQDLQRLLRSASRSGDEVLARAVAEKATEIGDDTTMREFLATRPNSQAAGERLWNAQHASKATRAQSAFIAGGLVNALVPPALGRLHPSQIATLAEQEQ